MSRISHISATRRHGAHVFTPVDGTYALVFDEEFNGSAVDSTKWFVFTGTNSSLSPNTTFTSGANTVSGGFLRMAGTAPSGYATPPYNGGLLYTGTSSGNFHFGPTSYIEARIKFPTTGGVSGTQGQGWWGGFWGNGYYTGGANSDPPEIDFPEMHAAYPTSIWPLTVFQYPGSTVYEGIPLSPYNASGDGFPVFTGSDLGGGFHVYGMLWTSSAVTFYHDGSEVGTMVNGALDYNGATISIPTANIAVILQSSIDNHGAPDAPSASSVYPQTMIVDYVHVYTVGGSAISPQTNYGGPGDSVGSGSPSS